ncbi:MAG: ATP-binding protein [Spirochaetia bacterium]|nr:ATP-binding protein [Spirochaetia bacterium]
MVQRNVWKRCINWLERKEILLIIGARQAGKSTLMREMVSHVKKFTPHVHFFSLENPLILSAFDENPENLFNYIPRNGTNRYVFLDEIQYLKDPTRFLKYLYDEYTPTLKLVVSGSSAFYIDKKFRDSLAGRKRIVELRPFSFSEFLVGRKQEALAERVREESTSPDTGKKSYLVPEKEKLQHLLNEYILYGGYPAVVTEEDPEEKLFTLKDLHESFLRKDIHEAGVLEEYKFFLLLKIIASGTGALLNANELANTVGLSGDTVREYIHIMRKSFIIALVTPFHRNLRKELTKMPKAYLLDSGLRNIILNDFRAPFEKPDRGCLLENLVFIALKQAGVEKINYWRTQDKKEVDFIVDGSRAFEVKWRSEAFNPGKYRRFTEHYPDIPLNPVCWQDDNSPDLLDFLS